MSQRTEERTKTGLPLFGVYQSGVRQFEGRPRQLSDTKGRGRRFFGLAKPEWPAPDPGSVPALSKSRHEHFREHLLHSLSILGKGGYPLVYEGLWREPVDFAQHSLLQPFHDSGLDGFDIGQAEEGPGLS